MSGGERRRRRLRRTARPAPAEPATAGPATTGPATTEPATAERATTERATTEPATTEPATAEPATTGALRATTVPSGAPPRTAASAGASPAALASPRSPAQPGHRPSPADLAELAGTFALTAGVQDPEPECQHDNRYEEASTERGLRGLVGGGSSQVSVTAAMRARDASRPTDRHLASAETDLQIVRRGWVPREELPRPTRH